MEVSTGQLTEIIQHAFREDIGNGDHSALACIPDSATATAGLYIKEAGVLAGVELAKVAFQCFDQKLKPEVFIADGSEVRPGDLVFTVSGSARSLLTSERVILNFMQRMSGIATQTRAFVDKLKGTNTKILDTRKTTPGLRLLEKWAVTIGGGANHRFGLYDMIMIKDNHIDYCGGIEKAIQRVQDYLKANRLELKIEIETRNLAEIQQVLQFGGVDRIMLDNFSPKLATEAIRLIDRKVETELSGGITLNNIDQYALCGADFISVGALTHSVQSLDMSLKALR